MNVASATCVLQHTASLYHEGAVTECLEALSLAVVQHPEDGALWEFLGVVQHNQRDFAAAQQALETASVLTPLTSEGQAALADCYMRSGCQEPARTIYQHLATCQDLRTKLLAPLARRLAAFGDFHLALDACRVAASRLPDCDEAVYGMAYYMGKCGYPPERILPVAERAFRLAPDAMIYRVTVALLHQRLGDTHKAYKLLQALSPCQLLKIRCTSCLERVLEILAHVEDDHRRGVCLRHFEELQGRRGDGDV